MICRSLISRSTSRAPHDSLMRPSRHRTRSLFPPQKPTIFLTVLLLRLQTSRTATRPPPLSRHLYPHLYLQHNRNFNRNLLRNRLPSRVANERRECWCTAARASRAARQSCWRTFCCAHESRRRRSRTRYGSCAHGAACVRTMGSSHSSCSSIGVCILKKSGSGTRGTRRELDFVFTVVDGLFHIGIASHNHIGSFVVLLFTHISLYGTHLTYTRTSMSSFINLSHIYTYCT